MCTKMEVIVMLEDSLQIVRLLAVECLVDHEAHASYGSYGRRSKWRIASNKRSNANCML